MFSPLLPPSRYGGIEIIVSKLADAFAVSDDVHVVSLNPAISAIQERRIGKIRVSEFPGHFYSDLSTDMANGLALDVLARLSPVDADIVHCHDWFFAEAGMAVARRLSVPLFGYFHTVKVAEAEVLGLAVTPFRRFVQSRQQDLAAASHRVVVYSDFMRNEVISSLGVDEGKIVQFRCGPSLDASPVAPPARRSANPCVSLLYLGRLAPEKGVDILIEAFAGLKARGSAATLRVVGSGPLIGQLRAQVAAAGIVAWVEFEPFIASSAVLADVMASADAVIVPSQFEPYGLVAAEALCLGVPVIVSSETGLTEIARNGEYGEIFTAGSVQDLLHKLIAVEEDLAAARAKAALGQRFYLDRNAWLRAAQVVRSAHAGYVAELLAP